VKTSILAKIATCFQIVSKEILRLLLRRTIFNGHRNNTIILPYSTHYYKVIPINLARVSLFPASGGEK
jgi:hypothetical protein